MIRSVSISLICFAFGFILVGILAMLKRKDAVSLKFFIFSIMASGWGYYSALWLSAFDLEHTFQYQNYAQYFSAFIPVTWVHFVFTFIDKNTPFKLFYPTLYFYSCCLLLACLIGSYIHYPVAMGNELNAVLPKPLFSFLTLSFVTIVPFGFYHLWVKYRLSKGVYKKQIFFLMLATLLGFSGGGWTFIPVYFREVGLTPTHLVLLYPIFMGIALVRYNLFSEEDFVMAAHRDKLAFMGTLSSSINHEIRNPLYIAQGSSESFLQSLDENLISKNDAGEKAIQILRESKKQISRALDIVASFSNFTKIDAHEDQKTKVSVNQVINNVLTFVGHEATKKRIKITKDIEDESFKILVNERQLEQILLNLVLNAIQAFKASEGLIELSVKRNESQIEIKIADNGPGIPKKQLTQIFEPFHTTKEEGTGLGLYITKQLVERNSGSIRVESEEGKGTVFNLRFCISPQSSGER